MKKHLIAPAAALLIAAAAQSASASLLIYEPFDYTAGQAIAGQVNPSTGNTWNQAGPASANVHSVISPGLTSPSGFPSATGNAADLINADSTQFDRLDIPNAFNADLSPKYGANSTLYYSALVNVPDTAGLTTAHTNANANNDLIIGLNNTQGAQATRPSAWAGELTIRLGSATGTYNLGIRASSTAANTTYWSGDLNAGQSYLVVGEYAQGPTAGTTSNGTNSLWINPSSASFGLDEGTRPAPDGSTPGVINTSNPAVDNAESLLIGAGVAAGANPSHLTLDELRLGTTWADVTSAAVPEPASLGLLALGGLGLLRRRRHA
jgi:hypothetical protein